MVSDGGLILQDCTNQCSLLLQDFGFARLLSVVIWLLLLLIMVPNMALPIQQVQVHFVMLLLLLLLRLLLLLLLIMTHSTALLTEQAAAQYSV